MPKKKFFGESVNICEEFFDKHEAHYSRFINFFTKIFPCMAYN